MLDRVLEPEVMDTAEDAAEYDAMDHSVVNAQFVSDLITALTDRSLYRTVERLRHGSVAQILDLGSGTGQIPIELARRASNAQITAIDAAESMLRFAPACYCRRILTSGSTC